MSHLVDDDMMAQTVAAAGLTTADAVAGPGAIASPSYKALESRSVITQDMFVKRMHPEMMSEFNLDAAMTLASQAGKIGVGPEVIWHDASTGGIAMHCLGEGWSTGNQARLQDPATVSATIAALKALHATEALNSRFNPFAQIDALIAELDGVKDGLPDDIAWLRRLIAQVEPMLDTATLAPCRNDGSSSNLMLGPDGAVMLIDYDRAGMNDPLYDVGCLLVEITNMERDMRAGYAAYAGNFDEPGFARARLWSFVDDLLHALWARLHAKTSQRGSVEWLKYGEWRLIRMRMGLMHPQFEEQIRLAGEAA